MNTIELPTHIQELLNEGSHETAIQRLRESLEQDRTPENTYLLAYYLYTADQSSEAIELLDTIETNDEQIHHLRADIYMKHGMWSYAEKVLRQTIGLRETPLALYKLAITYAKGLEQPPSNAKAIVVELLEQAMAHEACPIEVYEWRIALDISSPSIFPLIYQIFKKFPERIDLKYKYTVRLINDKRNPFDLTEIIHELKNSGNQAYIWLAFEFYFEKKIFDTALQILNTFPIYIDEDSIFISLVFAETLFSSGSVQDSLEYYQLALDSTIDKDFLELARFGYIQSHILLDLESDIESLITLSIDEIFSQENNELGTYKNRIFSSFGSYYTTTVKQCIKNLNKKSLLESLPSIVKYKIILLNYLIYKENNIQDYQSIIDISNIINDHRLNGLLEEAYFHTGDIIKGFLTYLNNQLHDYIYDATIYEEHLYRNLDLNDYNININDINENIVYEIYDASYTMVSSWNNEQIELIFIPIVEDIILPSLFQRKFFNTVVNCIDKLYSYPFPYNIKNNSSILFKYAYSLNELSKTDSALYIYKLYLDTLGENPAVLNNLAIIYEKKMMLVESTQTISKAFSLFPNDDFVKRNYERIIKLAKEQNIIHIHFLSDDNTHQQVVRDYWEQTEDKRFKYTVTEVGKKHNLSKRDVLPYVRQYANVWKLGELCSSCSKPIRMLQSRNDATGRHYAQECDECRKIAQAKKDAEQALVRQAQRKKKIEAMEKAIAGGAYEGLPPLEFNFLLLLAITNDHHIAEKKMGLSSQQGAILLKKLEKAHLIDTSDGDVFIIETFATNLRRSHLAKTSRTYTDT